MTASGVRVSTLNSSGTPPVPRPPAPPSRTAHGQNRTALKRNRRRAMTPVARRRDVTREDLERSIRANADASENIAYAHTVLALCGFPYRRPPEGATEYKQTYGRNSLIVQAGHVLDPETRAMVKPGLPYGPKARLLMLHVCTEALRQNSNTIRVADSLSAF